ncbi:hypothetical protein FSP39_023216 [Pinctada imbricata]|uniref:TIR domain-containing protein n=1 Tax=Pinctada imbricata TaxID=66713 RepID=A0AA89CAD2_PINIB|nr:hypothetical protein FSP39_023216 [Pinctada imbricata]
MLDCTCDDVNKMYKWLPDFIRSSGSTFNRTVHCNINGKTIDARIVTSKYLGCEDNFILDNIVILIALFLLLLSVVLLTLIFLFRFELFIVYRKIKQKEVVAETYLHDIYISMENENEILLRWVLHQFCPSLENRGYKVFLPPRDMGVGCFREEVTRQIIKCSRCVVVFLTASFANGDDDWMALEWRVAWQQYKMNDSKKLIIVNYDQMRYGDVDDYVLGKYLWWGTCLDFCTRRKFLQSIITEIGKPCTTSKRFDKIQKTKFNSLQIMKGI